MTDPSPEFSDEGKRLRVVESFDAAELEDDPHLQAIVEFAAKLCDAPVSILTLIEKDRQRFLAREGLDWRESSRDVAFCVHTLGKADLLEVPDARVDARFAHNPLVTGDPNIRYYAGQPIISEEGASLGTLCVLDVRDGHQTLSDFQREGLAVLAQAAMQRLKARREGLRAEREIAEREERLRRMIDGVPQIAWSADSSGNFDYFNKRWREVTGENPPGLAEDWRQFIHEDDHEATFGDWYACFAAGEEFESEYRIRHADGSWHWVLAQAVPVAEHAGDPVRWFGTITDIDEVRLALEQRDLLANELSHRIKNIFAVVIGLLTLKARKTPEHQPFAKELAGVLHALGRAHEFVRPTYSSTQDKLQGLLAALFAPYAAIEGEPAVQISGADTPICARAATPLALVFHELATNSAKYGALSAEGGYVTLVVEDQGEKLLLTWREHGGPPVEDTITEGFGSRLVEMSITGQLQGSWNRRFESAGLVVELTVSKSAISS